MVSNGDGLGTQLKAVVIFVQTANAKKTLMAWGERVGEGVDFRRECRQAHNNSKAFSLKTKKFQKTGLEEPLLWGRLGDMSLLLGWDWQHLAGSASASQG